MNEHLKPDEAVMLERAEKATKGPWRIVRGSGALVPVHYIEAGTEREPSLIEAWSEDNETFIAAARTDLPTILTRLANERAKLAIAMEALEDCAQDLGLAGTEKGAYAALARINKLEQQHGKT